MTTRRARILRDPLASIYDRPVPIVTAEGIAGMIRARFPGAPVTCEQTGGGTATVYVGRPGQDDPWSGADPSEPFAWLAIGPGRYDWSASMLSTFVLSDLFIGPDDASGEGRPNMPTGEYVGSREALDTWLGLLCSECGHDGYDGHDMRSVPPACTAPGCPCGNSTGTV